MAQFEIKRLRHAEPYVSKSAMSSNPSDLHQAKELNQPSDEKLIEFIHCEMGDSAFDVNFPNWDSLTQDEKLSLIKDELKDTDYDLMSIGEFKKLKQEINQWKEMHRELKATLDLIQSIIATPELARAWGLLSKGLNKK